MQRLSIFDNHFVPAATAAETKKDSLTVLDNRTGTILSFLSI